MDKANVRASIERAVAAKVGKDELFTAFDITMVVRQSGLHVLHRDMNHDIHDAMVRLAGSAYGRTLISIPGIADRVFLYHPLHSHPITYLDEQVQVPLKPAIVPPEIIQLDVRGAIRIPARFIAGLNVMPQSPVYVTQHLLSDVNGKVVAGLRVTVAVPVSASSATEILVDRQGGITVSRGALVDAGLDGRCQYKAEGSNTEITVTPAD